MNVTLTLVYRIIERKILPQFSKIIQQRFLPFPTSTNMRTQIFRRSE